MLDEFSQSNCCPHLESYLDYRVIKYNKCLILETVYLDRGLSLHKMTKFEKAIIFKDIREHMLKILLTLSFLKARVVKNSTWLTSENIKFDLEDFQPRLNDFVVIDVKKTLNKIGQSKNIELAEVEGESQDHKIEGKWSHSTKKILIDRGDRFSKNRENSEKKGSFHFL